MITLSCHNLRVELCRPGEYYMGTRFDRAGVFRRIVQGDYVWADEWFDHCDPLRHDRVCGLSEEFVTVDFDGVAPGGLFCKPGVGLLRRPDAEPYDWFRLYELAEPGRWEVSALPDRASYTHILPGWYRYRKEIRLVGGDTLAISHEMRWEAGRSLKGFFYNHNFLTFGGKPVGPDRRILTPWTPCGHWRSEYDNVMMVPDGVRFTAGVDPACSVYCGDMRSTTGHTPCLFTVQDAGRRVRVEGDMALDHVVLWSNPRVACMEPYMPVSMTAGEKAGWTFTYRLE